MTADLEHRIYYIPKYCTEILWIKKNWTVLHKHPLLSSFLTNIVFIQMYSHGIELACQKQKEFVKSSVACKWNLAEAQQKLGSLALHNSESLDQEHAKAQTAVSELRQREEEWRQKEEALVQREKMCLWSMDAISKDVFNKVWLCIEPQWKKKNWSVCTNQLCVFGSKAAESHKQCSILTVYERCLKSLWKSESLKALAVELQTPGS